MTRLQVGEYITEFPAGTWNKLVDLLEEVEQLGGIAALAAQENGPGLAKGVEILVVNKTGTDLKEQCIAGLDKPALDEPTIDTENQGDATTAQHPHFEVVAATEADHAAKFVLTLEPIKQDATGKALLPNATWARVDVKSDSDEVCGVKTGEPEYLVSGMGSTPILWKPAGTGKKWCVVQLGGASAKAKLIGALAIIKGTVPAASSISVGGTIDENTVLVNFGKLTKDATASTFTAGALIVGDDGKAIMEDDGNGGQQIKTMDVLNTSYTDFIGEGPGVAIAGSIAEREEDDGNGGTTTVRHFLLPVDDFRALPGFAKGSAPSGSDDPDLQIPYHSGGADDFKLSSDDCTGGA